MFQCKCFSVLVDGSTRIREGEELKFLERQRGVLQKVFSRGKNLPIVMILMLKGAGTFHSASQSKEGSGWPKNGPFGTKKGQTW